jgi:hypothetical protein
MIVYCLGNLTCIYMHTVLHKDRVPPRRLCIQCRRAECEDWRFILTIIQLGSQSGDKTTNQRLGPTPITQLIKAFNSLKISRRLEYVGVAKLSTAGLKEQLIDCLLVVAGVCHR